MATCSSVRRREWLGSDCCISFGLEKNQDPSGRLQAAPTIMVRTMRNLVACCGVLVLAWAATFAAHGQISAPNQQSGLTITTQPPASAIVGRTFNFPLLATGGELPYSWHLVEGQLPPGLKLQAHTAVISGVPSTAGAYRFTVAVADSSAPPLQFQRSVVITVLSGLTIDWKQYPTVQGNTLSGSVAVTNEVGQDLDLTVVVVAVNGIGRATALGYQHLTIAADQSGLVIPFTGSPGMGAYVVHADAVAHHPGTHHGYIYRVRKQTSQALPITQH
jgi:Putative Ig domain